MTRFRSTSIRTMAITAMLSASMMGAAMTTAAQTPDVAGCAAVATPATMPGMDHGGMHHATPTPMAGMNHEDHGHMDGTPMPAMQDVEFDLLYIDMMIPHHESVIALAEVAQHELTHPDLIEMAQAIVATQDAEIEELQLLRDAWYGDADIAPMDIMMDAMPGMGTDMAMMDQQMSSEWQVQTFCAADDKDLAFVEQVIPHHQMAVDTSMDALDRAVHPELEAIAQRVIEDQQHEIDQLQEIRQELQATPES